MQTSLIVVAALTGLLAALCFVVAYRQHKHKGAIWTNAWLYASKNEREKMPPCFQIGGAQAFAKRVLFDRHNVCDCNGVAAY